MNIMNINEIAGSGFGYEIAEHQLDAARAAGLLIHSFYRHEDDEQLTHYAADAAFVAAYHRSGGTWAYSS